jgi:hypothetical protein
MACGLFVLVGLTRNYLMTQTKPRPLALPPPHPPYPQPRFVTTHLALIPYHRFEGHWEQRNNVLFPEVATRARFIIAKTCSGSVIKKVAAV